MPKEVDVSDEFIEEIDEKALSLTRNTKSVALEDLQPGEYRENGSYLDAYGQIHYANGAIYKAATADKRLTANGAFAGRHKAMSFSEEEIKDNPFLALDPKDMLTLIAHLEGRSRRQIAEDLEISEQTVTTRLSKSSVKACLISVKENYEQDLHSLTDLAVNAVRDGLDPDMDILTRLSSADRVFKATGRFDKKTESKTETATDQMKEVLAALQVNINIVNQS